MLNSTFSYPDSLYIELRNNHSLYLINLADKANISFIIIQESSICNAFSEFFQLLADSEYITPENQTRTLIQKYIRQLKQLTFGITPQNFFISSYDFTYFFLFSVNALVKSDNLLGDLIGGNGNLSSAPSRQVHGTSHNSISQMMEQADVMILNISPQFTLLL